MECNNCATSEAQGTSVVLLVCIKSMLMAILKQFIKLTKLICVNLHMLKLTGLSFNGRSKIIMDHSSATILPVLKS